MSRTEIAETGAFAGCIDIAFQESDRGISHFAPPWEIRNRLYPKFLRIVRLVTTSNPKHVFLSAITLAIREGHTEIDD